MRIKKTSKYIPYGKMSKAKKKSLSNAKRILWSHYGCLSPVSKVIPDKKKETNKRYCRLPHGND